MSLVDYRKRRTTTFRGWRSYVDETDVPVPFALNARNIRYKPGEVGSRPGHISVFTPELGPVTSLHNWVTSTFNVLIFFEGGQYARIRAYGGNYPLFTQSGYGLSVGELGKRAAVATYNSSGLGAGQCRVLDLTSGPWPLYVDKAFPGPMQAVPVITESLAPGDITAGTHKFGYILATRTGFIGKPGPVDASGIFSPVSFTASGGKTLLMTLDATWPSDAMYVYPIMTTVSNPDQWYFIPNASYAVPPGAHFPENFALSVADTSLVFSQGDLDANEHFLLLTQDKDGNGPFNPSVVIPYGTRMVYVADDTLYISESGKYQHLTADQHVKYLPGKLRVVTGFVIGSTLYVMGPHWTYALSDNADVPATWAVPREIDGRIGALGPMAVTARASKGYGWVADEAGLFHFSGGVYDDLPVSYYNTPEWKRINRAAAHTIKVIDNYKEQYVEVYAPLDNATTPSHILRWSYLRGKTADTVDFSLDQISGSGGTPYSIGSAALVEDPATKVLSRWLGPGTAGGKVLREDPDAITDDSNGFTATWRSPLFPLDDDRETEQNVLRAYALRLKGSGSLILKSYPMSAATGEDLPPIALEENPKLDTLRRMHHLCQQESLELSTNSGWWKLSRLTVYWSDWGNR